MSDWMKPRASFGPDEPEFMASYGRALAEWGNVEHELARIYCKLVKPKDGKQATIGFFAITNFRDRKNVVDAIVKHSFGDADEFPPHEVAEAWGKASRAVARGSSRRNKLAHLHVWWGSEDGTFGHGHLYQVSDLPRKKRERIKEIVTIRTLNDYSKSFCVVWKRLDAFCDLLP